MKAAKVVVQHGNLGADLVAGGIEHLPVQPVLAVSDIFTPGNDKPTPFNGDDLGVTLISEIGRLNEQFTRDSVARRVVNAISHVRVIRSVRADRAFYRHLTDDEAPPFESRNDRLVFGHA